MTGYCTTASSENLTCFHSQQFPGGKDSFCYGGSAVFDVTKRKFKLGCELRQLDEVEMTNGIPEFESLRSYGHSTGPRVTFDGFIEMSTKMNVGPDVNIGSNMDVGPAANPTRNFTIIVKREDHLNPWHCLLDIMSAMLTIDILRMASNPATQAPFFGLQDAESTQIVVVDDLGDGPFFDLWKFFAKRDPVRLNDMSTDTIIENIIVPLPGASNPLLHGDWDIHSCSHSALIRTFTHRVLDFYSIDSWTPHSGDIVLTFIESRSRRLLGREDYLEYVRWKFPHVKVQSIDFEAISFEEQLRIIRGTDILVGVHGAELTHAIFLREGSVVVEILPDTMNHKKYRNLAGLRGHGYLSAHAPRFSGAVENGAGSNSQDVFLEDNRFFELVAVAVKVLYNKGLRSIDMN